MSYTNLLKMIADVAAAESIKSDCHDKKCNIKLIIARQGCCRIGFVMSFKTRTAR